MCEIDISLGLPDTLIPPFSFTHTPSIKSTITSAVIQHIRIIMFPFPTHSNKIAHTKGWGMCEIYRHFPGPTRYTHSPFFLHALYRYICTAVKTGPDKYVCVFLLVVAHKMLFDLTHMEG